MSFLDKLFGSRSAEGPRSSAEDWQAGDLAECITDGPWFRYATGKRSSSGPKRGERYIVREVTIGESGRLMLGFALFGGRRYCARGFRKGRPQADELVAADANFLRLLGGRERVL